MPAPTAGQAQAASCFDIELELLLEGVFRRYQHDFRHYARASLKRRIGVAMERFGCRTVSQLQDRLLHEPAVFADMLQYFTVQVSRNYLAAGGKGSLSDYYVAAYNGAILGAAFKSKVVFADHSLATDSVFSEVHLVSCRNVLIYFDKTLQNRAVGLFREALVHRGFLGIGMRSSRWSACRWPTAAAVAGSDSACISCAISPACTAAPWPPNPSPRTASCFE